MNIILSSVPRGGRRNQSVSDAGSKEIRCLENLYFGNLSVFIMHCNRSKKAIRGYYFGWITRTHGHLNLWLDMLFYYNICKRNKSLAYTLCNSLA